MPSTDIYQTSLVIQGLDGRKYTYDVYRTEAYSTNNDHYLMMKGSVGLGDAFDSFYHIKNVSLSRISGKLFDLYEEIRGLVRPAIPLNQHTSDIFINLFRELFNLIALNNYLRQHYPELEAHQVSLSDFDEDRHFVSFLNSQKERVPGKLIEVNSHSAIVEDVSGHRSTLEGEALNTVLQDKSVKLLFQSSHSGGVNTPEIGNPPLIQRQGEISLIQNWKCQAIQLETPLEEL